MFILNLWGEIRELFLRLDMVAFSFIDNIYELFTAIAGESLISETIVKQVLNNIYVLVGIFAFFRIAMLLINSIINPDALNKQGAGLSKIFVNMVIMLVLLVFTPTLFQMSRNLAKEVVEGNYIQKLFININDTENTMEPGKEMQRIAIGAVVTPEEDFIKENGGTCGNDCEKALQCLNNINGIGEDDKTNKATKLGEGSKECMNDDGVAWGKLANYNGVREKDENGDKVYVYNYKPLVLTIVGWTITYILLSFTFDVAKRMIELAVLEIVSPLFIATIVDPKSMQSGPFKKWLKTLGNSYASLFLRIAAISIMLLCVRLLTYWHPAANIGGFGKLIVLIAFLIFVKQLPKWFSNMLGMDGDGTGLSNLGIGKKIGGAALVGGLATKAGHALAGAAAGGAIGAHNQLRNRRATRKALAAQNGLNKGIGKEAIKARRAWYGANDLSDATYAQKRKALRAARKDAYGKDGSYAGFDKDGNVANKSFATGAKQLGASIVGSAIGGGRSGVKAENMKGVFSGSINAANQFGKSVNMRGTGIAENINTALNNGEKSMQGIFGTKKQRGDVKDSQERAIAYSQLSPSFKNNNSMESIPLIPKDFEKAFNGVVGGMDTINTVLGLKSKPQFKDAIISTENGITKLTNTDGIELASIDAKNSRMKIGNDVYTAGDGKYETERDALIATGENAFSKNKNGESPGAANFEAMFAEMQRNAVSATISNNAQMANLMQQKSSAQESMAYDTNQARAIVGAAGIAVDGNIQGIAGTVRLEDATMADLRNAMNFSSSSISEEVKNGFRKHSDSFEASQRISDSSDKQINIYQNNNTALENLVQTIRDDKPENKDKTLEALNEVATKTAEKKKSYYEDLSNKEEKKSE